MAVSIGMSLDVLLRQFCTSSAKMQGQLLNPLSIVLKYIIAGAVGFIGQFAILDVSIA
jgi:hypothetical protein